MKVPQGPTPRELLDAGGAPLRRPVVYLDWSTLSYACPDPDAVAGPDGVADRALGELVAEIACRGTLCASIAHVNELTAMPSLDAALTRARWLDRLKLAWVNIATAEKDELVHAVRLQLGLTDAAPRLPVHHTMTAAVRDNLGKMTPGKVAGLLSDPTIAGFVRKAHGRIKSMETKTWSADLFKRLHMDRATLPDGTTPETVHEATFAKFAEALKVKARDAIHMEPVIIGAPSLTDAEIDTAVDRLLDDWSSLPMNRVGHYVWRQVGDRITKQEAESGKFSERYGSFLWDLRHLVGGSFADVFTCDHFVDKVLADFRTQRGLPRQLSIGGCGDRTRFAAALRQQFETVAAV